MASTPHSRLYIAMISGVMIGVAWTSMLWVSSASGGFHWSWWFPIILATVDWFAINMIKAGGTDPSDVLNGEDGKVDPKVKVWFVLAIVLGFFAVTLGAFLAGMADEEKGAWEGSILVLQPCLIVFSAVIFLMAGGRERRGFF